jgi:hypothetical protein
MFNGSVVNTRKKQIARRSLKVPSFLEEEKKLNTYSRYTEGVQTDNETHSVSYSICAEGSSTKLKTADV